MISLFQKPGLDLDWCMRPEKGLPKPDLVVFLNLPPCVAAERFSFGAERYENIEFQNKVISNFHKLRGPNWMVSIFSQNEQDWLFLGLSPVAFMVQDVGALFS